MSRMTVQPIMRRASDFAPLIQIIVDAGDCGSLAIGFASRRCPGVLIHP
jgi:hypothetical protein